MNEQAPHTEAPPGGWRLKLGATLFASSIALPAAGVPAVASMGFTGAQTATVSGVLLVSAELMGLAAVAVMGKSGFEFIKSRVFAFLRRHAPPDTVGRTRYNIGLVFAVPVLFGALGFYVLPLVQRTGIDPIFFSLAGDAMLLASLFVLGGDFWDKLRSLFVHDQKVRFPD